MPRKCRSKFWKSMGKHYSCASKLAKMPKIVQNSSKVIPKGSKMERSANSIPKQNLLQDTHILKNWKDSHPLNIPSLKFSVNDFFEMIYARLPKRLFTNSYVRTQFAQKLATELPKISLGENPMMIFYLLGIFWQPWKELLTLLKLTFYTNIDW